MACALRGEDVLTILPTGGGKYRIAPPDEVLKLKPELQRVA